MVLWTGALGIGRNHLEVAKSFHTLVQLECMASSLTVDRISSNTNGNASNQLLLELAAISDAFNWR